MIKVDEHLAEDIQLLHLQGKCTHSSEPVVAMCLDCFGFLCRDCFFDSGLALQHGGESRIAELNTIIKQSLSDLNRKQEEIS